MEKEVLGDIPFMINTANLIKSLHIDEEDAVRFKQLVNEAQAVGRPKGIYKLSYVESKYENFVILDGIEFTSRVLRVNLENTHRIFAFVATCGTELESWSHSFNDVIERYWADTIKETVLCSAMEVLIAHLKENHPVGPVSLMTPGSLEDWPMEEQQNLFELIGNVRDLIGVELTDSYLMIPVKSISGIIFPTDVDFASCQLCPRERCPGRRMPYDSELYNRKYSKKI